MFSIHDAAAVNDVGDGVLTWNTSLFHASVVASSAEGAVICRNESIKKCFRWKTLEIFLFFYEHIAVDEVVEKNGFDMVMNNKCA